MCNWNTKLSLSAKICLLYRKIRRIKEPSIDKQIWMIADPSTATYDNNFGANSRFFYSLASLWRVKLWPNTLIPTTPIVFVPLFFQTITPSFLLEQNHSRCLFVMTRELHEDDVRSYYTSGSSLFLIVPRSQRCSCEVRIHSSLVIAHPPIALFLDLTY